jgi:hypothetical protein
MNLFRFIRDNKAVAAIEFALIAPIMFMLFLGGFELTRYVLIYQKISKTTASMSDLISRSPELYEADIANSFNAVQHLLEPYYEDTKVKVIISSVMDNGAGNLINWQRCGGGTLDVDSELGQEGDYFALPAGFDLNLNEDSIVAEVYFEYESIVGIDITGSGILRKVRYNKPRLGALTEIKDDAGVTGC